MLIIFPNDPHFRLLNLKWNCNKQKNTNADNNNNNNNNNNDNNNADNIDVDNIQSR